MSSEVSSCLELVLKFLFRTVFAVVHSLLIRVDEATHSDSNQQEMEKNKMYLPV